MWLCRGILTIPTLFSCLQCYVLCTRGGVGGAYLAPIAHLWNFLLAFNLQIYPPIDWHTTRKTSSILLGGARNLPRCQLNQSRFTVPPSPAAAGHPLPAVYMNRQPRGIRGRVVTDRSRHTVFVAVNIIDRMQCTSAALESVFDFTFFPAEPTSKSTDSVNLKLFCALYTPHSDQISHCSKQVNHPLFCRETMGEKGRN